MIILELIAIDLVIGAILIIIYGDRVKKWIHSNHPKKD